MGERRNKVREGLHVDDDRKSIFEKDPDTGETTIYRQFGEDEEWHEYHPRRESSNDDEKEG